MDCWEKDKSGRIRFKYGQTDYGRAAEAAAACRAFREDDEDESVSDTARSCYNCRYRRWSMDSFECLKA